MKDMVFLNEKKSTSGITLVALVVTIVVLLILAGITITVLFSDNGIIKTAQDAKNAWNNAEKTDQEGITNLTEKMENILNSAGVRYIPTDLTDAVNTGRTVTETTTVTDENGESITIPKDFKVTADSKEVKKGVVIEDSIGNQFVWVPVPNVTTMYEIQNGEKVGKLYDFSTTGYTAKTYPGKNTGNREPDILTDQYYDTYSTNLSILGLTTGDEFADQLQNEFNNMIASVEKYKGFYIGRYQTGNLKKNITAIPVVKKGETSTYDVNWYYQYHNSKKIAGDNTAVTTGMIWGSQWDRTLQWLVESGNKTNAEIVDSSSWGEFARQPTGTNEAWKANNIYDLAGNVMDWTIEAYDIGYRVGHRKQKLL